MPSRNVQFPAGVNVSGRYPKWPVFKCPLMAGFGCPPRPVPPIIDAELFRRSQAIHYDNSRFSPRHLKSGHYLLRRVVRCRVCDLAMSCHRMRGRNGTFHHYYYCVDKLVWGEVRRRGVS